MWTEWLVPMFPVRTISLGCLSKSKFWLLNPIVSRCLFDTFVCFGFIPQQTLNSDWHSVLLVLWLVSMTTDLKKKKLMWFSTCSLSQWFISGLRTPTWQPHWNDFPQGDSTFSAQLLVKPLGPQRQPSAACRRRGCLSYTRPGND